MGRVRRYKKVKSVDPFFKGKKNKFDDKDQNLPPGVKNHVAQRLNNVEGGNTQKNKRKLPEWAKKELKETAKRVREEHDQLQNLRTPEVKPQRPTIEGKREDESLRAFNRRVREGTAQLLKEAFREQSTSVKKRKTYLEERKQKNKLKKQGLWEEFKRRERVDAEGAADEVQEEEGRRTGPRGVGARALANRRDAAGDGPAVLGRGRADDEEGASFPSAERIRFGDVAHAPPDLAKIPKPRGFRDQGESKPWARGHRSAGKAGQDHPGEGADSAADREATEARKRQMEEMRHRVQEAYASLKNKRRGGQTQFVSRDL